MTPRDLTADLPAPRDDEPASLRDDIADELRDHLECALRREELHSRSEPWGSAPRSDAGNESCGRSPDRATDGGAEPRRSPAYARVLERFGNPRAVARKLWFDAMQERIMAQRITAVMAAIGAAACVAACLVLWQFVQDSRASQAAALAEMRDFNAKLLAGLQRPAETATKSEWAKVRIKVVDADNGQPVTDATVKLEGHAFAGDADGSIRLEGKPVNGVVDLGAVPFGRFQLIVESETRDVSLSELILIGPDHPAELLLRVPASATVAAQRLEVSPPDDVHESVRFVIHLRQPPTVVDGHSWTQTNLNASLVVDRTGRIEHTLADWSHYRRHDGRRVQAFSVRPVGDLPSLPLSIGQISVIERLPVGVTSKAGELPTSGTEGFNAYPLLTYDLPVPSNVTERAGGYRVELPEHFWQQVTDAEVRARLRPPPSGWKIVDVPLSGELDADAIYAERRVDVMLSYFSRGHAGVNHLSVRLTKASEIVAVQDHQYELNSSDPYPWHCALLVTDTQAEAIDIARRLEGARFELKLVKGDVASVENQASDMSLLEALKADANVNDSQKPDGSSSPADG